MNRVNQDVAGRLEEAAKLLQDQGADRYRVGAYLRAASSVRAMQVPLDQVLRNGGLDGLKQVPHVGETIARAIRELLTHGRLPMLDRLRGEADPVALLASVPGIGPVLSTRLHEELASKHSPILKRRLTMVALRQLSDSARNGSRASAIRWPTGLDAYG